MTDQQKNSPAADREALAEQVRTLHYLSRAEDDVQAITDFILARDKAQALKLLERVKAVAPPDIDIESRRHIYALDEEHAKQETYDRAQNTNNRLWRTALDNIMEEYK